MIKITPYKKNPNSSINPYWDNTKQLLKILYRVKSHGTLFFIAIKKNASLKRLLVTRFPFLLPNSKFPPSMHIEFTDACNLKCVYCNNPHFSNPRDVMKEETFDKLINELKKSKVDRICIGGGEATLHPKFNEFVPKLAKVSKILTIVTNGHWKSNETAKILLTAPVDFIEISVECEGKNNLENTRIGSDYELLVKNLTELKTLKKKLSSKSHINIRLMVRPSQLGKIEKESMKFWGQFGDSIMPQYVQKIREIETIEDAFMPEQIAKNEVPKCTLPFRNIQVRSNGDIPICQVSGSSLEPSLKLITGNINKHSINEVWNGKDFKAFRHAHRKRELEEVEICKGCRGN